MKILVAGDYCEKLRVASAVCEGNFSSLFDEIKTIVKSADISIVNFEFPIATESSYPIKKNGPNLKGTKHSIGAIKYAGFNVCTLANNHILDQGEDSCIQTKKSLESEGIKTVGVGINLTDSNKVLYLLKGSKTVALINCCEHEFSVATDTSIGACPLNPIAQYYSIKEAKNKADYVIVITHGGHERCQIPSPRMQDLYRYYIDLGADAVVNHHQHCYSGYETYKGKYILYGLGNLCFDHKVDRNTIWNQGYMAVLDFEDNNLGLELIPYRQCDDLIGVHPLSEGERKTFEVNLKKINNILVDRNKLCDEHEKWMRCNSSDCMLFFEPYRGALLRKLFKKGLLPSFAKKNQSRLLGYITCESHIERLISYLNNL